MGVILLTHAVGRARFLAEVKTQEVVVVKDISIRMLAYVATDRILERMSIVGMLRDLYEVRLFSDGDEVLSAFEKEIPDLIVIDYCFPQSGGLPLLQTLRTKLPGGDIPDVIFSCRHDLDVGEESIVERDMNAVLLPDLVFGSGVFFRTVVLEFMNLSLARA